VGNLGRRGHRGIATHLELPANFLGGGSLGLACPVYAVNLEATSWRALANEHAPTLLGVDQPL
jgi:hypothetical protein